MGTTVSNGYNATTGRPVGTTQDAGFNASQRRPMGTTCDKGFAVSTGRPLGTTYNNSSKSSLIEDDPGKLNEHIKYDVPLTWNTDINCLSLNKDMINRGRKMIGQLVRFDSKPLGIGISTYACGINIAVVILCAILLLLWGDI